MTEITEQETTSAEVIDHEYTQEVVCPYCGREYTDSCEFKDDQEFKCDECNETFSVERIIDVSYTTSKIEGAGINELPHKPTLEELEELFAEDTSRKDDET